MVTDGKFLWQRLDELIALLDSLMNRIVPAEADSPELSHAQIHDRLLEIKKYIEEMK